MGMVSLPAGLVPQLGTDWSPVGQIYFYTIESKNPEIDVMEIKSIEDWTLEKQFKQVSGRRRRIQPRRRDEGISDPPRSRQTRLLRVEHSPG